jgi:hypothetical protein
MDTSKLVVGHDVYVVQPPFPCWPCRDCVLEGKVVKVTPKGVEVDVIAELLRLDANGVPASIGCKLSLAPPQRLVVGREIEVPRWWRYWWNNSKRGKVVEVTPEGVEVEVVDLFRFDNNGNQLDVSSGFAPWHLDDIPFAERTTWLEQQGREAKAEREAHESRAWREAREAGEALAAAVKARRDRERKS